MIWLALSADCLTSLIIITKFYFSLVFSIHENTIENYKIPKLEHEVLIYHTRAIATEKGLKELEEQLVNNQL